MFRDSRGVVHTVSSADPLDDLPEAGSSALAGALLVPVGGDLGGALERCEAVSRLLERWQDAFFAALPDDIDVEEERRWAAEAGLSLEEIEAQSDWGDDDEDEDDDGEAREEIDLLQLPDLDVAADPEVAGPLDEELVTELELALLLLPLRVRLEALVAAALLVDTWADLLADHEKCLGHLVLEHGASPGPLPHDVLADQHARLHAGRAGH